MAGTMFVALIMLLGQKTEAPFSYPLEIMIVMLSLVLIGAGRYSLDYIISKKLRRKREVQTPN